MRASYLLAFLLSLATAAPAALIDLPCQHVALSNGGEIVAVSTGNAVLVVRAKDRVLLADEPAKGTVVTCIDLAPDGSVLAIGTRAGGVQYVPLADRTAARSFVAHSAAVSSVAFDGTGRVLATASLDGKVAAWLVRNNASRARLAGHAGLATAVAWDATTGTPISAGRDGKLLAWSFDTFTPTTLLEVPGESVRAISSARVSSGYLVATEEGSVFRFAAGQAPARLDGGPVPDCTRQNPLVSIVEVRGMAIVARADEVAFVLVGGAWKPLSFPARDFATAEGVVAFAGRYGTSVLAEKAFVTLLPLPLPTR